MRYLRDADVEHLVSLEDAIGAVERGFRSLGQGTAALQPRLRTGSGGTKLSTLGAVLPDDGILGLKAYATTRQGHFRFLVVLFDYESGEPVATLQGRAVTALRTAATSCLAAKLLARPASARLVVFGAGAQAGAHAEAFAQVFPLEHIDVVHRREAHELVERLAARHRISVREARAEEALPQADMVVTATRRPSPLFAGALLPAGVHITALGATRPDIRELDAVAVGRSHRVVVEWVEQARVEAGDLILAAEDGTFRWDRAIQLGDLVAGQITGRASPEEITLFDSVGVGVMDVAVAALALRRAVEDGSGTVVS